MMRVHDYYLEPLHEMMKAEIMKSHHVHCDEAPFIMPSTARNICGYSTCLEGRIHILCTCTNTLAAEAVKRIDAMYHLDNGYRESSAEEKLDNRQQSVKPLVDAYFAWGSIPGTS